MLTHLNKVRMKPTRVIVIGGRGFVGSAICKALEKENIEFLSISRADVDLLSESAPSQLKAIIRPTDSIVLACAIAPVKNLEMLRKNLKMVSTFEQVLSETSVSHILNISSDAIYGDFDTPMTEASMTNTNALHGIMHLTREIVLQEAAGDIPFASLRPTLIYGEEDPHNGYGPNRFRRLAKEGMKIVLFGEGEERRDHVAVNDVAALTVRILMHRSIGTLNAATGEVISFRECADFIATLYETNVEVIGSRRVGPMPHNGYRAFDASATKEAFPDFDYTDPLSGFLKFIDKK